METSSSQTVASPRRARRVLPALLSMAAAVGALKLAEIRRLRKRNETLIEERALAEADR